MHGIYHNAQNVYHNAQYLNVSECMAQIIMAIYIIMHSIYHHGNNNQRSTMVWHGKWEKWGQSSGHLAPYQSTGWPSCLAPIVEVLKSTRTRRDLRIQRGILKKNPTNSLEHSPNPNVFWVIARNSHLGGNRLQQAHKHIATVYLGVNQGSSLAFIHMEDEMRDEMGPHAQSMRQ